MGTSLELANVERFHHGAMEREEVEMEEEDCL